MNSVQHRAAALGAAALSLAACAFAAPVGAALVPDDPARSGPVATNLHRARVLFDGSARAVWVGDSWATLQSTSRLPYGSLMVWPIGKLSALTATFRTGAMGEATDFTGGAGRMVYVDHPRLWSVEYDQVFGQQHFALPVFDMTKVVGRDTLTLDESWADMPLIQAQTVRNNRISLGDLPDFSDSGEFLGCRLLYYAPLTQSNLLSHVRVADRDGTRFGGFDLRAHARPLWHLGETPGVDAPRAPVASQINAIATDFAVNADYLQGPGIMVGQDPAHPLIDSGTYWINAGAVYYHTDAAGVPLPGYYHSGLATGSWSFAGLADDTPSTGGKNFSDAQLLHWLDVTTLDRARTPVVILHIATEDKERDIIEERVRRIIERFRTAYARIGTTPPRFLLVGSFMHEIRERPLETARQRVEELDVIYESLARTEPDCAFFSLYRATDGVFLSTDAYGGPGTQQASRDWLDQNGWSTITYGGSTYTLSSADDDGLDGVILFDGLHTNTTPATALFAKLLGNAIASSVCPADFNGDGAGNTLDVIAFLNAWNAGESSADIDGNGVIDTRDVLAFLNVWTAGC